MKRRTFTKAFATTALTLAPTTRLLINALGMTEHTMKPLRGNVGYFTERGGTIGWLIEDGAVVIVDTQFPAQANNLLGEIKSRTEAQIDLVINTHHHGDHTAGNVVFEDLAKSMIAHENSKTNQERSAESKGNLDQIYLPTATFKDKWSSKIGSETITMQYWGAGHTNGDALTHFENANVVHAGDLIFNRRFPYIDKGAGASIEGWVELLTKCQKHYDDDTIFICGHSANGHDTIIDKSDIEAFRHYLGKVLDFVRAELKVGKSEETIMTATAIPGAPEWKGNGIQRSLSAAIMEIRDGK